MAPPDDLYELLGKIEQELGLKPTQTIVAVLKLALPLWAQVQLQSADQFKHALEVALGKPSAGSQTLVQSPPTRQKRGR